MNTCYGAHSIPRGIVNPKIGSEDTGGRGGWGARRDGSHVEVLNDASIPPGELNAEAKHELVSIGLWCGCHC